jgi:hypothetical protein
MPTVTIDPSVSDFSRQTALYLGNASDLAYSDDPVEAARELLGLEVVPFRHPQSATNGFAGRASAFAVLAFRGSESITEHPKDWLVDIDFLQTQTDDYPGRVHAGFSGALAGAWETVDGVLRRALTAVAAGVPLPPISRR